MYKIQTTTSILKRLRAINDECGGITADMIQAVAGEFGVPAQRVEGLTTFYSLLNRSDASARAQKQFASVTD